MKMDYDFHWKSNIIRGQFGKYRRKLNLRPVGQQVKNYRKWNRGTLGFNVINPMKIV